MLPPTGANTTKKNVYTPEQFSHKMMIGTKFIKRISWYKYLNKYLNLGLTRKQCFFYLNFDISGKMTYGRAFEEPVHTYL